MLVRISLLAWIAAFWHFRAAKTASKEYSPLNFNGHFGSTPEPFHIDVDPDFIQRTVDKVGLTRPPIDIEEPLFTEGIPSSNLTEIAQYWQRQYNWSSVESNLNQQLNQFTTTVQILNDTQTNYSHPIPLHFVHHKSIQNDAIPLLFVHGWPGSFLEVGKIIEDLVNPASASDPAFHVVAPSIPGFGFSPAPQYPGLGLIEAGAAFHRLMNQLGYSRYVVHGGDFGSHVARYMGAAYPHAVAGILCNLYGVFANSTDLERESRNETTPEENTYIAFLNQTVPFAEAFWGIHAAVPLQMGILLTDSPVGNLAWPYLGMRGLTPGYEWLVEDLITWSMMLYIQGPYGSVRMFRELQREGTLNYDFPYVSVPVGVLQYYGEAVYGAPKDWCERTGNVTYFVRKAKSVLGGHFPAQVNPNDLVGEIRKFWSSPVGGWKV